VLEIVSVAGILSSGYCAVGESTGSLNFELMEHLKVALSINNPRSSFESPVTASKT